MERLQLEQECKILTSLINEDFINRGSSRAVYNFSIEDAAALGIELPYDCVVKLAIGVGGLNQNALEVKTFLAHPELPLAEIVACGRYIVIMEKVSIEDGAFVDYLDSYLEPAEYLSSYFEELSVEDYDRYLKELQEVDNVVEELVPIFGQTADNGQLGYNRDGRLVAYDYGFETEGGCDTYCSDEQDWDNFYEDDFLINLTSIMRDQPQNIAAQAKKTLTYSELSSIILLER